MKLAIERATELTIVRYDRNGELRARPKVCFQQGISETEYYTDGLDRHRVLHAVALHARNHEASAILGALEMCDGTCKNHGAYSGSVSKGITALVTLLDAARRSLEF